MPAFPRDLSSELSNNSGAISVIVLQILHSGHAVLNSSPIILVLTIIIDLTFYRPLFVLFLICSLTASSGSGLPPP